MTLNLMSAIREKLRKRLVETLDSIEFDMKSQLHLTNASSIINQLEVADGLWSIMSEDEREFIGSIRYAIENKIKWEL